MIDNSNDRYNQAKQATFNITASPVFSEEINPGAVGENILTYMQSKSEILKISRLEPGEFFQGVVYCTRTFASANVNDPNKYDISFTLIDGDGMQFYAKKWGCDEKIEHIDTPLYIEGTTISYTDGVIRYRVDAFKRYMTEVPKSVFLKQIPLIEEHMGRMYKYISEIETPCLKKVILNLLDDYGFMNTLKESTYKPTIGTQLGCKILLSNVIISMIDTFQSNLSTSMDRDIYISLTILYMIDLSIKQSSQSNSVQKSVQVSTSVTNAMYNSACFSADGAEQERVQAIFNGLISIYETKDVYNIPTECLLFNNVLQTVERGLRSNLYSK